MRIVGPHRLETENTNTGLAITFGIVLPLLLIGFVFYLRKERYIRRRTAYLTIAALVLVLLVVAAQISGISA